MRVLVTGADGFVGTHMVRGLRAAGHEVHGAVFGRAARAHEVRVDLTREAELVALPAGIQAVVNAAGLVDPKVGAPAMFEVNFVGTRHLVAWARAQRVRHFVQLSSVAVYGPLVLGEDRDESTRRLGLLAGLPYMRSKAQAERVVERSGVPYTLLRPPAVVGRGDTVLSRGIVSALENGVLPLVPGARSDRRVSVAFADGLAAIAARALDREPLNGAIHAIDAQLTLAELAQAYGRIVRRPWNFAHVPWAEVFAKRADPGFAWLVASARFGQHYASGRLLRELGYASDLSLESAVSAGISSLQGGEAGLF